MSITPTLAVCLAIITRILECFLFCVIDTLPILFPLVCCRLLDIFAISERLFSAVICTLWLELLCCEYFRCFWYSSLCCLTVNRLSWRGGDNETICKTSPYKHPSRNSQSMCAQWVPTSYGHLTIWVDIFWMHVITCTDVSFLGSKTYSWKAGAWVSF